MQTAEQLDALLELLELSGLLYAEVNEEAGEVRYLVHPGIQVTGLGRMNHVVTQGGCKGHTDWFGPEPLPPSEVFRRGGSRNAHLFATDAEADAQWWQYLALKWEDDDEE